MNKLNLIPEAKRLRIEDKLSLKEIAVKLGVAKSTVSLWLRDIINLHPESDEHKKERYKNISLQKKKPREPQSKFIAWIENDKLTNARRGRIAEAAVLLRLSILGYSVFSSVFDGDKVDFLVRNKNNLLVKIQVKWANYKTKYGLPSFSLRYCANSRYHSGTRYKEGDFDFIVGYDMGSDTAYVYSFDDVKNNDSSVTVSAQYAEKWEKLNK